MKSLLNIQEKVKDILTEHPQTRNNDMLLYLKLVNQIDEVAMKLPFEKVIADLEKYKFPSFESVGRARRKMQEKHPELRANKKVQQFRAEKEEVYKEYAKV